ncbi:glycosyltransferase involved in cell wall biosynthesis [Nocardioides cavernae]|uniref:Glycosyltransferase involved in cell wall biosynthesis n=1 Tax=Nocardioides cavernae TaxID=1921566 RepID=A0A7Y9H6S4_9ACTN|nr:glycosyltransferase family 4 protein [Nocardioides cavernae]NYE38748.1 glycosyltransferase involved in cell wall biosynthesis [Nocardioides cavernae]
MQGADPASLAGRHVVFFNWRDTQNPEGGGSERYVEAMARGLVEHGARATIFCAAHDHAPADEVVDGVRYVRRGDHLAIYVLGALHLLLRRFGTVDLVVDVQNGLPFFTRFATRAPVVVLVHHVHREQWPVVFPGLLGRVGWWIERVAAPRIYRRSQYVAVSRATRAELIALGVERERIAVVHNGTAPAPALDVRRSPTPVLCVLGRLVPHKQVEHAIDAIAAVREDHPEARLVVVGNGWWEQELRDHVEARGLGEAVTFTGHVSEHEKHTILAASWLMLLPSLKEGWGIVIGEAGSHGVPTVAYASAGGTRESIADGTSGLLVDSREDLIATARRLVGDDAERRRLGKGARELSHTFSWAHSQESFAHVLADAIAGRHTSVVDPEGS